MADLEALLTAWRPKSEAYAKRVGYEIVEEFYDAAVSGADAIRDGFDCLAVIVHHCPHDANRPRGHSSLMGALDIQIAVRRDIANNVVAELELAKDGEVGLTFLSQLERIELGHDKEATRSPHASSERLRAMKRRPRPSRPRGANRMKLRRSKAPLWTPTNGSPMQLRRRPTSTASP
jgi:hypothetical protein